MATKPGPIFNQDINRLGPVMGSKPEEKNQTEDAFRLNVWTTGSHTKKPVLFWIHGGGFLTGGGALPWYNGQSLAENGDIVVVNVNYRLGALGHLYQPGVADDNLALHDLITALTWVKDNIAVFGGDPEQITVAGQSVGAWYTLALFASPMASQLINRIGLLSFPGAAEPLTKEKAAMLTAILLAP
ncbi:carboxylesterase family protein [Leuconostoc lactis]|uniref:carboxylesterase family protein n=1 Tax=Leuconostoc lactis TaxID=1246 RepID=UPI001F412B83|nr:carboxylesterase family protein [Leuconostoc lactis]